MAHLGFISFFSNPSNMTPLHIISSNMGAAITIDKNEGSDMLAASSVAFFTCSRYSRALSEKGIKSTNRLMGSNTMVDNGMMENTSR